jgi:hypothetical protein
MVEVDGVGFVENGTTVDILDDTVTLYVERNGGFRNGHGVTFSGVPMLPDPEPVDYEPLVVHGPGDTVQLDDKGQEVDLDKMSLKKLHEYNENLGEPFDLNGLRTKAEVLARIRGEEVNND